MYSEQKRLNSACTWLDSIFFKHYLSIVYRYRVIDSLVFSAYIYVERRTPQKNMH